MHDYATSVLVVAVAARHALHRGDLEQADRLIVRAMRAEGAVISIDTMKPEVMRAAAAEGASLWNDVTALGFSPDSAAVAAELGCEVMLMHMQGEPRTMQAAPTYKDVMNYLATLWGFTVRLESVNEDGSIESTHECRVEKRTGSRQNDAIAWTLPDAFRQHDD